MDAQPARVRRKRSSHPGFYGSGLSSIDDKNVTDAESDDAALVPAGSFIDPEPGVWQKPGCHRLFQTLADVGSEARKSLCTRFLQVSSAGELTLRYVISSFRDWRAPTSCVCLSLSRSLAWLLHWSTCLLTRHPFYLIYFGEHYLLIILLIQPSTHTFFFFTSCVNILFIPSLSVQPTPSQIVALPLVFSSKALAD